MIVHVDIVAHSLQLAIVATWAIPIHEFFFKVGFHYQYQQYSMLWWYSLLNFVTKFLKQFKWLVSSPSYKSTYFQVERWHPPKHTSASISLNHECLLPMHLPRSSSASSFYLVQGEEFTRRGPSSFLWSSNLKKPYLLFLTFYISF